MCDDLVTFRIPADFVLARCRPRAGELAYGLSRGWLDDAGAVAIAERERADGLRLSAPVEDLALLLRAEHAKAPGIAARVPVRGEDADLWLYLALAWVRENRDRFDDPFAVVEMLYADFGYPDQMDGLVRYMPAADDAPVGLPWIETRWDTYLAERGRHYADRPWHDTED